MCVSYIFFLKQKGKQLGKKEEMLIAFLCLCSLRKKDDWPIVWLRHGLKQTKQDAVFFHCRFLPLTFNVDDVRIRSTGEANAAPDMPTTIHPSMQSFEQAQMVALNSLRLRPNDYDGPSSNDGDVPTNS